MIKYLIFLFIILFSSHVIADNMTYRFSSPSFNGMGTSAHFLTIENQEHTRKAEIKAKRESLEAKRLSDAKNTNYRYLRNAYVIKLNSICNTSAFGISKV